MKKQGSPHLWKKQSAKRKEPIYQLVTSILDQQFFKDYTRAMNISEWKNFLIPPIAIYGVIFLFISFLIGAKIDPEALWVWVVSLSIQIVGLYLATSYVKPKNIQDALKFGAIWVVILFIFDLILTVPFTGMGFFFDWKSYVSYFLTLIVPAILSRKK